MSPDAPFIVSSERWQIVKGKSVWAARPETSSLVGWEIGSSEDFFSQSRLWPLWTEKNHPQREIILIRRKPIKWLKKDYQRNWFYLNYFISNIFYGLWEIQNTASDGFNRAYFFNTPSLALSRRNFCGWKFLKMGILIFIKWYVYPFQRWICPNWFDLHLAVLGVNQSFSRGFDSY